MTKFEWDAYDYFCEEMAKALCGNENRGSWGIANTKDLMANLHKNVHGLVGCVTDESDLKYASKCCVDIANYALMLHDIFNQEKKG